MSQSKDSILELSLGASSQKSLIETSISQLQSELQKDIADMASQTSSLQTLNNKIQEENKRLSLELAANLFQIAEKETIAESLRESLNDAKAKMSQMVDEKRVTELEKDIEMLRQATDSDAQEKLSMKSRIQEDTAKIEALEVSLSDYILNQSFWLTLLQAKLADAMHLVHQRREDESSESRVRKEYELLLAQQEQHAKELRTTHEFEKANAIRALTSRYDKQTAELEKQLSRSSDAIARDLVTAMILYKRLRVLKGADTTFIYRRLRKIYDRKQRRRSRYYKTPCSQ